MMMATSAEMKNNFGKYLGLVMSGQEVIVTRNVGDFALSIELAAGIGVLRENGDGGCKAFRVDPRPARKGRRGGELFRTDRHPARKTDEAGKPFCTDLHRVKEVR